MKSINNIYSLINNPFKLYELLVEFYSHCKAKEENYLIAYLVFPLVLNNQSRKKLKNLKSTSNLLTFSKNIESIIGLELMIKDYRNITNQCIQIGISEGYLQLTEKGTLIRTKKKMKRKYFNESEYNIALRKFAFVIEKKNLVEIYCMLGVREI